MAMEHILVLAEKIQELPDEEIIKEIEKLSAMETRYLILSVIRDRQTLRDVIDEYIEEKDKEVKISKHHPDNQQAVEFTEEYGKVNKELHGQVFKVTISDFLITQKQVDRTFITKIAGETSGRIKVKDGEPTKTAGSFIFEGYNNIHNKFPDSAYFGPEGRKLPYFGPRGSIVLEYPSAEELRVFLEE